MATYGGSSGPSNVEDMFVTAQADFTRSPLPVRADEYFVRQPPTLPPVVEAVRQGFVILLTLFNSKRSSR